MDSLGSHGTRGSECVERGAEVQRLCHTVSSLETQRHEGQERLQMTRSRQDANPQCFRNQDEVSAQERVRSGVEANAQTTETPGPSPVTLAAVLAVKTIKFDRENENRGTVKRDSLLRTFAVNGVNGH